MSPCHIRMHLPSYSSSLELSNFQHQQTSDAQSCDSLGGFAALAVAANLPEKVTGVVLLNSAGQFGDADPKAAESEDNPLQKFILKPLKEAFQRIVLGFLFWQAKQPARIVSVLKSVSCYCPKSPCIYENISFKH